LKEELHYAKEAMGADDDTISQEECGNKSMFLGRELFQRFSKQKHTQQ